MAEGISRDELTAAVEAFREGMASDRAERIEQMGRFENKFDTRMDAIYQMLSDFKEKNSSTTARQAAHESALDTYMRAADRRFTDILSHFDNRLNAQQNTLDSSLKGVASKQDRNWGWVMALIGSVIILILQSFWNLSHPNSPPVSVVNDPPSVTAPKR
jgi:predicted negative regulator of RcsB-dependent stress response